MPNTSSKVAPLVGIIMGSTSDWPTMKKAADALDKLAVPYETRVVSAHRTPDRLVEYAKTAQARGLKVIVAGAGGAAHLPGMAASMTILPVLGVPVQSKALLGQDSLLSIVQMPAGIPVGTLAIGEAGATNAGLLAAQILALQDPALAKRLAALRAEQTASVPESPIPVSPAGRRVMAARKTLRGPLPPGSTIGILGSGQLARMLIVAASRLGFNCHIYADAAGPACDLTPLVTIKPYDDRIALATFAQSVDVVTFEFENVPEATAKTLALHVAVRPNAKAFAIAQDRLAEKMFIQGLGLAVAPFVSVPNAKSAAKALAKLKAPSILKTCRLGYDGKGQTSLAPGDDAEAAWRRIGGLPAVLETRLAFRQEISVILARASGGAMQLYDIPQNSHVGGILRRSVVPAPLDAETISRAQDMAEAIADALDFIGVLAIEMFDLGPDVPLAQRLLINEIAPRVHNSGHWTIDACACSQFENQIRAVADWPLGSAERHSDAEMVNLIGEDARAWRDLAADPDCSLHLYGKRDIREGRKLGHATRLFPKGTRA